jgi:hypothetical protein
MQLIFFLVLNRQISLIRERIWTYLLFLKVVGARIRFRVRIESDAAPQPDIKSEYYFFKKNTYRNLNCRRSQSQADGTA